MYKLLGLVAVLGCASAPPPKINTPQDFQTNVADLVTQVIDAFKTDGTNCDMLSHDLHSIKGSSKFKAAQEWSKSHPDGPQLAQAKINEKKADFDTASAAAMRQCGGSVSALLQDLTH